MTNMLAGLNRRRGHDNSCILRVKDLIPLFMVTAMAAAALTFLTASPVEAWIPSPSSSVSSQSRSRQSSLAKQSSSTTTSETTPHRSLHSLQSSSRISTALELSPSLDSSANTLLLAETESWRQYVPLVVSCFVIIDILLGSPAANAVLGAMRPKEEGMEDEQSGAPDAMTTSNSPFASLMQGLTGEQQDAGVTGSRNPKERVDTQAVAQQALDKASATKELRQFLDDNKSDWDKMKEIQQKMDEDLVQFDENIERQRTEMENEIKSMDEKKK